VRRKASVVLLSTLALLAIAAAPVAAARPSSDYKDPVVNWIQPNVVARDNGTATVHVQYTCYGGNAGTHVYIGVKQGPQVYMEPVDHTASKWADTFYSTNWNPDSGVNALVCNGRKHNQLFLLKPDPYWTKAEGAPALSAGIAFVQVCIFDSHNAGEGDLTGFAADYSMRPVVED
jgi:hypothetical protein